MSARASGPRAVILKLQLVGLTLVLLMVAGFGGWAATAELSGAVVASGVLVVESNVKKVQHPGGGVIGELHVREGDAVQAGQVVMRLDDTVARSSQGVLRSQLDDLLAREARLLAEREDSAEVLFPQELMLRRTEKPVESAMAGELKLFVSRRGARQGQRSQLRERVAQGREEITGLTALRAAKEREIALIDEEMTGVEMLWTKNLVPMTRLKTLQRDKARLEGERGQYMAEIARARGKISETELQILQLDQDFQTELLKELRDAQGRIAELRERLTAAEDQLKRIDIRAPQNGMIHQLAVHTVGGVISSGDTLMLVVPTSDKLIVEAKVMPQDVDQVQAGNVAQVRIQAGNQRTTPSITAIVTSVSPDLTRDPPSASGSAFPYYLVRLALAEEEVQALKGLTLVSGMAVEAFIHTHPRTPLEYLMKPLNDQILKAFRER